jgi:type IV pilus assembly protein PilM
MALFGKRRRSRPRRGRFVAVDFDSWHLRIVQAEATADGIRILKLAAADVPEDLSFDDPEAVGEHLGQALRQAGVGAGGIVMNVPRSQAVLKPLQLPAVASEDELARMVLFQVEKELPFPAGESAVDFAVERHYDAESRPENGKAGVHVLVAAVRQAVVDHYQRIAAKAGVRLYRLGLRPYADVRAVQAYSRPPDRDSLFVLHVTADEVEINILAGSALAFSRSAGIKLLAEASDEFEAEADDQGLADPVHKVVMEVARSLRSYQSVEPGRAIETAVIAGGTGVEEHLAEELERHLGLECVPFDPGRALSLPEGRGREAGAFISALGLAVGYEKTGSLPYDFVAPKRPPARVNRTRRIGAAIGAVAVAVVLAAVAGAGLYLRAKAAAVEELTEKLSALEPTNRRVKDLEERLAEVEQWREGARPWLEHWTRLHAVFPPCEEIYASKVEVTPDGSLQFTVRATETDVIDDLGLRLNEAGYSFRPNPILTVKSDPRYPISTKVRVLIDPDREVDLTDLSVPPRPSDDISAALLAQGKDWGQLEARGMNAVRQEGSTAQATGAPSRPGDRELARLILQRYDRNKDGRLTHREAYQAKRAMYRNPASPWDADGDGKMSAAEYRTLNDVIGTLQD